MAVYPNSECYDLCTWMLDIFVPRLTGPQITLTTAIQAAALAQTSVTDQEWKDFQNYAQWRNPYYIVYRDYQKSQVQNIEDGLLHFYNFDGNSNDSVGSLNGTDSAVTYSTAYGKIGQGVRPNNTSAYIEFGSTSDFNFIHQTGVFSVNLWFQPVNIASQYSVLGSVAAFASKGFWLELTNGDLMRAVVPLGTSSSTNVPLIYLSQMLQDTAYHMYTVTSDGVNLVFYRDGVVIGQSRWTAYATGNATNTLKLFLITGLSGSASCNVDLLSFWDRALTPSEVLWLHNGGAGRSYPF